MPDMLTWAASAKSYFLLARTLTSSRLRRSQDKTQRLLLANDMRSSRSYSRFQQHYVKKTEMWFGGFVWTWNCRSQSCWWDSHFELEIRTFKTTRMTFKYSRSNDEVVKKFLNVDPSDGDVKLVSEGGRFPATGSSWWPSPHRCSRLCLRWTAGEGDKLWKLVDCTPEVAQEFADASYRDAAKRLGKALELMYRVVEFAWEVSGRFADWRVCGFLMDIMDVNNVLGLMLWWTNLVCRWCYWYADHWLMKEQLM